MQIFGLHKNIYKLANYARRQESLSEQAEKCRKWLGDWEKLKSKKVPDKIISEVTSISRSTYYRRKRAIKLFGITGFDKKSTKPRTLRQSKIPDSTKRLILKIRKENPTYGKAKITVIIKRDHDINISESSVGRVLKLLILKGKIIPSISSSRKARRRTFKSHAKRFKYGMKAIKPGELIQIDHMSVTKNNITMKHFQAWDPITKTIVADLTSNATSRAAAKFLDKVIKDMPFKVISVQVDGGSEFMKDFEQGCAKNNIPLYVLPPKRPQWNGGVERGNRTFREEFYASDLLAESLGAVRHELDKAVKKYNTYRPHFSLKGLTPYDYTQKILSNAA